MKNKQLKINHSFILNLSTSHFSFFALLNTNVLQTVLLFVTDCNHVVDKRSVIIVVKEAIKGRTHWIYIEYYLN